MVDISTTTTNEFKTIDAGYEQPTAMVAKLCDDQSHDVTEAYLLAVLSAWEFSLTGKCARMEDLLSLLDGMICATLGPSGSGGPRSPASTHPSTA